MMQEEEGVKKTVQYYFDGTSQGDIDLLKKGYTPDCKIYFINDKGELDFYDQQQFHEIIRQMTAKKLERVNELLSLEVTKNIAMVKARSDYPDFYFMDYLSLIKIGGEWKIVGKTTVKTVK